jgi:hypothetical protein
MNQLHNRASKNPPPLFRANGKVYKKKIFSPSKKKSKGQLGNECPLNEGQ